MQIWPALRDPRRAAPATADSMQTRSVTIMGQDPPSSMVSGRAAGTRWAIFAPVAVEPVNATLSSPGWPASAGPAGSSPDTRFAPPGGGPAPAIQENSRAGEREAYGDGLTTMVQPAATAAHSFQPMSSSG